MSAPDDILSDMAYVGVADTIAAGEAELAGPTVRSVLGRERREQFEAEFRLAVAEVTHSYDVEQLAEVVRRWWILAGGDRVVADSDRADAARSVGRAPQKREDQHRPHEPRRFVSRTGPSVWEALDEPDRVAFQAQLQRALAEAATIYDHRPAQDVIVRWWPVAMLEANPDVREQIDEVRRQLDAGDPGVLGATTTYPHARPAT